MEEEGERRVNNLQQLRSMGKAQDSRREGVGGEGRETELARGYFV
jgi:hypothetical protein